MSEDCLYINVVTSKRCLESPSGCPVMFYIFGGAFVFGSPIEYRPEILVRVCLCAERRSGFLRPSDRTEYLRIMNLTTDLNILSDEMSCCFQTDNFVSRDIVFVIPNYRMGILGMWHTDSDDTTGNYASYG